MYKSVQRISILKRAKVFLSPNVFNKVQCSRNKSGLEKKERKVLTYLAEIEPFTDFLHLRREQAKRSIIVKIPDFSMWENLIGFCNKYAAINKVYHYSANFDNFVLIEMESEKDYQSLLKATQKNQIFDVLCHFFKLTHSFKTENSLIPQNISNKISLKVSLDNSKDLSSIGMSKTDSLSALILKVYDSMKISDLGIRLRFLTCRQIELILKGIASNAIIYPFGSSVSGLGLNGCDLDMVVTYYNEDQGPFSMASTTYLKDTYDTRNKLDTMFKVMMNFRNDLANIFIVKNARVPIIKFKNKFTKVECDLSLGSTLPVIASQILYALTFLDENIRPFIFIIKVWAKRSNIIVKYPAKTFSSFCVTMLTVFFLQQSESLIPPWSILAKNYSNDQILNEDEIYFNLINFRSLGTANDITLENLLLLFFKYYSTFDFKNHGISVKRGEIIANHSGNPIFIENPLEIKKNVGQNITSKEVASFQALCSKAVKILSENTNNKTKLCSLLQMNRKSRDLLHNLKTEVTIGDVRKKITPPKKPQYIPHKYLSMGELSQNTLRHLRWMLQKDLLKQDIFLIGRPGPIRRQLAMIFLEMTNREVEYVSLSRDTTEADLKQRREILGGTAQYFDQNAVRAAVEGRVLILEGIEKAERNVLPVLNNLLENREMHLEDGRFLIPASRYDKLLKEHSKEELDRWNLVRVSDEFRVIALGLPVPKYSGNPLDPPLRSRFQARNISHTTFQEQLAALKEIAPNADPEKVSQLLSCSYALTTEDSASLGLPDFPVDNIPKLGHILRQFPNVNTADLINQLYPYRSFLNKEGHEAVKHIFDTFQVKEKESSGNKLEEVKCSSDGSVATCRVSYNGSHVQVEVPCGSLASVEVVSKYVPTNFQESLIVKLLQSHSVADFCLIGPKGCGKSATVLRLANMLNYEVEPIVLYQDITSRDLIQQRTTLPNGDTVWKNSPLIQAALSGKLAILDGIDRVHPSTLSVVHSLVQDRDVQLYDGKRLVRHDRYEEIKKQHKLSDEEMSASGILKVHPSFRIVALAESLQKGVNPSKWLSAEMLSLFLFHEMRLLSSKEEKQIIKSLYGSTNAKIEKILNLAVTLRTNEEPTLESLSPFFSTRQLLRVSKRLSKYPNDSVYDTIQKACLARFLPPITKDALDKAMKKEGIEPDLSVENPDITCHVDDKIVRIGSTEVARYDAKTKSKVPDILFYDVPQHLVLLEWLIQDFNLGEHLLLVGNQGVGKNKIADRLLQLLNRPREYIQLHRDTTVQTLTLQPTVKDGVVSYEDSPLVQAVKSGHVLVVDEADKAPTHVTCILKTLVERGEMTLSDGRRIVPHGDSRANKPNVIEVHPDFRMIVLANRPGFPFLGNDFFGALGDLFSCHAVDNPSPESEIALLKQYGPDVPEDTILKLVRAFGELRTMADKGAVQYPYSTREVVNIVKHLQSFPGELLTNVVSNVFDFDKHSTNVLETLIPVLQKHGIPVNTSVKNVSLAREFALPKILKYGLWRINKISTDSSNLLVEVKNIKVSGKRNLSATKSQVDVTEARGTMFSELHSYLSLPMPVGNVVLGMTASRDEKNSRDLINVLTVNPFRLYITSPTTRDVKIVGMEAFLPRIGNGARYKFSLVPLGNHLSDSLLIHEENLNHLLIVDTAKNAAATIDLSSTSEKLMKVFKQTFVGKWKMNHQLANKNIIILYLYKHGMIEVLDLNKMTGYSFEVPLQLKSVQVVADGKWMLQNSDNRKYLLVKKKPEDEIPSVFQHVAESLADVSDMGIIHTCLDKDLEDEVLSKVLGEKISAPNRLILTDETYAAVSVGFPELDSSSNEIYYWPRTNDSRGWSGLQGQSVYLEKSSQVVTPVSKTMTPKEVREEYGLALAFLEVIDLKRKSLQYIPISETPEMTWYIDSSHLGVYLSKMSDERLVTIDFNGNIRYWETGFLNLQRSLDDWMKLVGEGEGHLQLTIERDSGKDVSEPKHGKVDPTNAPHVGGNTWAGGTGGRDTAGLGGKGGPYRLDAGHDVYQISDYEKSQVPEEVKKAAREMGLKAFKQRLKEIKMSQYDHDTYLSYYTPVAQQVKMLKVIIDNVQRKSKEREWVRHQTTGVLDDLKLIEGLTGEKTIFRRRTEKEPEPGAPIMKPKRLKLVADVSGSMLRFNSYDGRLNRMLEASVLVMEAFQDQESKFKYDITGHSGDGYNLPFVDPEKPPKNNKERLEVIKTMYAHSQFCMSGDHTLPATMNAIESVAKEDCDEAIVIVMSDANLERYGIRPSSFSRVLTSNPDVNAFAILIGSLGDQANRLAAVLPAGRAFVCMDLSKIPQIMQQIFTASVLSSA